MRPPSRDERLLGRVPSEMKTHAHMSGPDARAKAFLVTNNNPPCDFRRGRALVPGRAKQFSVWNLFSCK